MIASQSKPLAERPWLDPAARPQILIDGVSKTYGAATAVDNVTLSIYKGEMFALVGASGCGKDDAAARRWPGSRSRRAGASASTAPTWASSRRTSAP